MGPLQSPGVDRSQEIYMFIQSYPIHFNVLCHQAFGRDDGEVIFCSFSDRVKCLKEAVTDLINIVRGPFIGIAECWQTPVHSGAGQVDNSQEQAYSSRGWKLLDGTLWFLLSSLLFLISMIRNLAGAILHPAIALAE
jgi:hypothetical protein